MRSATVRCLIRVWLSDDLLIHADALNRFRITHPDRDLRPLLRRLHRLQHPKLSPNQDEGGPIVEDEEQARERESLKLEVLKWKANVERLLGSVGNLERQRAVYLRRAEETGQSCLHMISAKR